MFPSILQATAIPLSTRPTIDRTYHIACFCLCLTMLAPVQTFKKSRTNPDNTKVTPKRDRMILKIGKQHSMQWQVINQIPTHLAHATQFTINSPRFLELSCAKIASNVAIQVKKAILHGTPTHHMLFQGKRLLTPLQGSIIWFRQKSSATMYLNATPPLFLL